MRGWASRCLLPDEWACDVAATYLTLRLEEAERHWGRPWSQVANVAAVAGSPITADVTYRLRLGDGKAQRVLDLAVIDLVVVHQTGEDG